MTLKVIIAGVGMAGSWHINSCQQIPEIKVAAVCDADRDRANIVAEQYDILNVYPSLKDALKSHPADIVHVCTPPSSHFELCRIALNQGCHVLVEKPMFETLEQAERIHEIVDRNGGKFSVVHNGKYQQGMAQATKLAKDGFVGEVRKISVVRMLDGNKDRMIPEPKSWSHKLPGGRWEELISHPIYKARQFMGPIRFVHLEMKRLYNHWPWLPADELEIILEGESGYVCIKLSANADNQDFMLLHGAKRLLYVDRNAAFEPLSPEFQGNTRRLLRCLGRRLLFAGGFRSKPVHRSAHAELIKDFIDYVSGKRDEAPVDWEEAYNTLELGIQIGKEIYRRRPLFDTKKPLQNQKTLTSAEQEVPGFSRQIIER